VFARTFDVSPDGQRFLMIKGTAADQAPTMVVILNWVEELKAKLPAQSGACGAGQPVIWGSAPPRRPA
jgi:hypothetical protein